MYKFTNGIVVFDEETRDKYIQAGYILVKEDKKVEKKEIDNGKADDKPISGEYSRKQEDTRKNRKPNWK